MEPTHMMTFSTPMCTNAKDDRKRHQKCLTHIEYIATLVNQSINIYFQYISILNNKKQRHKFYFIFKFK